MNNRAEATVRQQMDRRKHPRLPPPTCVSCQDAPMAVILRTERMTYVQCGQCHQVRSIPTSACTIEQPAPNARAMLGL